MSSRRSMADDAGLTGGSRAMFDPIRLFLPKAAAIAGLALVTACTSTESQMDTTDTMLPQPQVVIVDTFAVSPEEVKLYEGLAGDVEEALKGGDAPSRSEQEKEVGHQVADAIAETLVTEIQDLGLSAERGSAVPAGTDPALLITGQLLSIDEGNRAERVVVGFGAGRSDVRAHAQVYEVTAAGRQLIDTIEVDGASGLSPGMAETMGVGALAGHVLVSAAVSGGVHAVSETMATGVVADADRAAKGIAKHLGVLFGKEGWVSQ